MPYISKYLTSVYVRFVFPLRPSPIILRKRLTAVIVFFNFGWKYSLFPVSSFLRLASWSVAYLFSSFSGSTVNINLHWTVVITLWDEPFFGSDLKEFRVFCKRPCANKLVLSSHDCLFNELRVFLSIFAALLDIFFHLVHSLHEQEFCITVEIFWVIKQQAISGCDFLRHKYN